MKLKSIAAAVALAATATGAQAVLFNFDGQAGGAPTLNVGSFDWGPTTIFAQGAATAAANWATNAQNGNNLLPTTFDSLAHATMIGALSPTNQALNIPGIGSTFEITLIARFTQTVTRVIPGIALPGNPAIGSILQSSVVTSVPGFLEMYYQAGSNSNALTGFGFNDGRLILSATSVGAANGTYTDSTAVVDTNNDGVPDAFVPLALDNFTAGDDDYSGQQTLKGSGSLDNVTVGNILFDPTFFVGGLESFALSFANISEALPFISVDPSHCFNPSAIGVGIGNSNAADTVCDNLHVDGLFSANSAGAGAGLLPVIGAINGLNGPDIIFQTDFNSPVNGLYRAPEPASLALIGLGLAGIAFGGRRRKQSQR